VDLFEAHRSGMPLAIDTGPDAGGERLIAEIFAHPRGILFADIGWPNATAHPFHVIEGDLVRGGDWRIGRWPIRPVIEGEPLYEQWLGWRDWRASDAGRGADAARAERLARSDGLFD
jgi:hypothetical protein